MRKGLDENMTGVMKFQNAAWHSIDEVSGC